MLLNVFTIITRTVPDGVRSKIVYRKSRAVRSTGIRGRNGTRNNKSSALRVGGPNRGYEIYRVARYLPVFVYRLPYSDGNVRSVFDYHGNAGGNRSAFRRADTLDVPRTVKRNFK